MSTSADSRAQARDVATRTGWFLAGLLAVATFNYLDRAVIGILQEPIKREFALSDFQLGLLGGPAFVLLYVSMGIPFGRLAERGNRVNIITASFLFWSMATTLCGVASGYLFLLLARIGVSVGEAGCAPCAHSLIADRFPPAKRSWALSVYTSGVSLGSLLAATVGGALAQQYGWRASFYALGIAGMVVALVFRFTVTESPRSTSAQETPTFAQTLRFLRGQRVVWHIAVAIMVAAMLSLTMTQYLASFFIRTHQLGIRSAGLHVALIAGVAGAIGTFAGGLIGNRLAARAPGAATRAVSLAYLLSAPILFVGLLTPNTALATVLLMFGTALQSSYFGPAFAALHATAEPRMRATAVALVLLVANLFGYGVGPPLVGAASDALQGKLMAGSAWTNQICNAWSWLRPACSMPNAGGLQWTLAVLTIVSLWACYHFHMISRHVGRP